MPSGNHIRIRDYILHIKDIDRAVPVKTDKNGNTTRLKIEFIMNNPIYLEDKRDIKAFLEYFSQDS